MRKGKRKGKRRWMTYPSRSSRRRTIPSYVRHMLHVRGEADLDIRFLFIFCTSLAFLVVKKLLKGKYKEETQKKNENRNLKIFILFIFNFLKIFLSITNYKKIIFFLIIFLFRTTIPTFKLQCHRLKAKHGVTNTRTFSTRNLTLNNPLKTIP